MTDAQKDTMASILREYGFATAVACACLWVGRQDIICPMVSAHREFLHELAATQRDISKALADQTKLLYAMQRHHEEMQQCSVETEN